MNETHQNVRSHNYDICTVNLHSYFEVHSSFNRFKDENVKINADIHISLNVNNFLSSNKKFSLKFCPSEETSIVSACIYFARIHEHIDLLVAVRY